MPNIIIIVIKEVCKKPFQKLAALSRLANYLEVEGRKFLTS